MNLFFQLVAFLTLRHFSSLFLINKYVKILLNQIKKKMGKKKIIHF